MCVRAAVTNNSRPAPASQALIQIKERTTGSLAGGYSKPKRRAKFRGEHDEHKETH
jgi:hypothetical protein